MDMKSVFKKGDNISGENITTGKYLGQVKLYKKKFHKIYDSNKNMTLFLSLDSTNSLRKLPSEKMAKENLRIFELKELIDVKEIDGSRYKYFKDKLKNSSFRQSIEVLHDLNILTLQKKASAIERKLYLNLKEQLMCEISFVMNMELDEAEEKYLH